MNYIELPFVKMSADAVTPTRATEGSVGLDLYSPANYMIPPHSQLLVPSQIKLRVPLGYYGRLASKSGLAILHQLHVGAGVIDPDYMGEIMVLLINTATFIKLPLDERKTLTKISTRKTSHNHSPNQRTPRTTKKQTTGYTKRTVCIIRGKTSNADPCNIGLKLLLKRTLIISHCQTNHNGCFLVTLLR